MERDGDHSAPPSPSRHRSSLISWSGRVRRLRLVRGPLVWLTGFAASATTVAGVAITGSRAVPWTAAWLYLLIVVLTPVFAAAAGLGRHLVERPRSRPRPIWRNRRRAFFFDWAVIWLAWVPVWLAGWPGFWCYDAYAAYRSVVRGEVTTAMPPLHSQLTTFIQTTVKAWTGANNYGIAAYILLQSLAVACVFAYTLRRLRAWRAPKAIRWGGLVYYAIFPTIALFSLSSARNTLFSAVILALAVCLVDALKAPRPNTPRPNTPRPRARRDRARPGNAWRWCLVGLLAVAAITLRRDALYAFLLFTVLAAVLYRPARKALALTFVSASILGLLLDPVLYKGIMGAKEGTSIAAYSVPLQQLARVYSRSPDSLTPEQRQQLESFVEPEALAAYRPQLADPVMVGANADRIAADTKRFVKLWAEIGLAHPAEYVDAALANTVEGWLPGAVIDAYAAPGAGPLNPTAGTSYFCFATEQPGQATPKGPQFIHDLYADFSKYSRTPFEIPVLAWLWSPGTYLWAFAFALAISWSATRRGRPSAFMPVALLLLATCAPIFLGPTMLVRYFLQLFYCAPLLAAFLADPRVCGLPPAQDKVAAQGDSHAAAQTHQSAVERSPRTP